MAEDVVITVRLPVAMDEELSKLSAELGRNKSELIREAIAALIGMMRNASKPT